VALSIVLDQPLDIDADAIDAGGSRPSRQMWIASDDGEGE
jgi:hypothetical protein